MARCLFIPLAMVWGCYLSHAIPEESDVPVEADEPVEHCEPTCVGQPDEMVEFSLSSLGAPLHFAMDACVRVTHDRAFLDAGGNDLNLSAAAIWWQRSACAPRFCNPLFASEYDDQPTDAESEYRIHFSADPSGDLSSAVQYDDCSGKIAYVIHYVAPDAARDLPPDYYLRAVGEAFGLMSSTPGVVSIVGTGTDRTDYVTLYDEAALCSLYGTGDCE